MRKYKRSFREERLEEIQRIIREKASVMVSDLAKQFHISESTVRLDLAKLEAENLITRTHGGAVINKRLSHLDAPEYETIRERSKILTKEKDAIGKLTASLIQDGDTILIDGGSTTPFVIKYIKEKNNLTIITNSMLIAQETMYNPKINLFLLGGLMFSKHGVTVGSITCEEIKSFYPNKTIINIDGVSAEKKLMSADPSVPAVVTVKIEMIKISDQLIVVCDHTKFNKICPMSVSPISRVDIIVTDKDAPQSAIKSITQKGTKVLVAE